MALRKMRRTNTPDVTFVSGILSQTGRSTQAEVDFLAHSVDLQENPPKVTRRNSLKSPLAPQKKNRLKAAASAVVAGNAIAGSTQGSRPGGAAAAAQGQAGEAAVGGDGAGADGGADAASRAAPSSPSGAAAAARLAQHRHSTPHQGELAQAIAERLRQRRASSMTCLTNGNAAPIAGGGRAEEERETTTPRRQLGAQHSSFAARGFDDGPWTSKFTAAMSPGALNRWNEQRPDPGWYKVQLGAVINRSMSCDFRERPKHRRLDDEDAGYTAPLGRSLRRAPTIRTSSAPPTPAGARARSNSPTSHCFLTSVDMEQESRPLKRVNSAPATPKRLAAALRPSSQQSGASVIMDKWALASARPDLGRIGRVHVIMNEVSYPAEDLGDQDIKGYHKLRYPRWDFAKGLPRPPLSDPSNVSCPGKYDPNYGSVKPRTTGFVQFDRVMPRGASVTTLGYSAPEAVLHPEEKRFRGGCIMDRSRAKDSVRHRITHVNNYDRDMGRPPPPSYKEYHNKHDPNACESVLRWMMEYDADKADRYTTHRRDIGPRYDTMIPRGKDAVQGNRGLSHDLGVRGAVGLGFVETAVQRGRNAPQRECRKADGARERPDMGPQFEHYTTFQTTVVQNNFVHGSAPVQGSGPKYNPKPSPLRRAATRPFERKADPGFEARNSLGGSRVAQEERTHEAMSILSGAVDSTY